MRLTAQDVQEHKFRVTFRGFDPAEVDALLQRVTDELERLSEEREGLKSELEEEKRARRTLEEALASVHTVQEGILERARHEAELTVHHAQQRSDRILAQANEELLRVRREVQSLKEGRANHLAELTGLAEALCAWVELKAKEREPEPPQLIGEEYREPPQPPAEGSSDLPAGAAAEDA